MTRLLALAAAAVSAVLIAGCAGAPQSTPVIPSVMPSAPSGLESFYSQPATWRNCGNADCMLVKVPLDYSNPTGATIELNVSRVSSSDGDLGSLFVNPGGPGGSAFDYAKFAEAVVNPDVLKHYDLIGVDPRGVASSSPIECLTDTQKDDLAAIDSTPDTPQEVDDLVSESATLRDGCAASGSPLFGRMGTADAARDLDIVRAVVGDSTFNYLGKSYGTYLGAVYAELFPTNVGRMVLDGVLPAGTDLIETTRMQAVALEGELRIFAQYCSESDGCPWQGSADQIVTQIQQWFTSLDAKPLVASDGRRLTQALAQSAVVSYLYFPPGDFEALIPALGSAVTDAQPDELLILRDQRAERDATGHYTSNALESFFAVTCVDRPFAGTSDDVAVLAREWATEAPTFGPALAWGLLSCAGWSVQDGASAPVTSVTAPGTGPILVVGTTYDPATPYAWAEQVAGELENASLLTWDAHQHTAYGRGSSCIDEQVNDYLISGKLPVQPAC
jgi:pimeloyl-ACP methyl ester carboxylesterase